MPLNDEKNSHRLKLGKMLSEAQQIFLLQFDQIFYD